jgi:AmiR/NasT family two-component response regulator
MSAHATHTLAGHRVLVIEDEYLIAMEIAEVLENAGAQIVGPAASLTRAAKLIRQNGFDMAVVDVKLRDGEAYQLVEALQAAGVPLVFLTGLEQAQISEAYRTLPHVIKPFGHRQLVSALADLNHYRMSPESV